MLSADNIFGVQRGSYAFDIAVTASIPEQRAISPVLVVSLQGGIVTFVQWDPAGRPEYPPCCRQPRPVGAGFKGLLADGPIHPSSCGRGFYTLA